MKEIIEKLRAEANENIAIYAQHIDHTSWGNQMGVLITNGQALQIADALEVATFPPIVRAVLAWLEFAENIQNDWVAVDRDGEVFDYDFEPFLTASTWIPEKGNCRVHFSFKGNFNHEALLFHRTESGWQWCGNPNKQNIEQHGK